MCPKFDPSILVKWCKWIGGECDTPHNCNRCYFKMSQR